MPPKKKVVAAPKVTFPKQSLLEPEITPSDPKKIPKKPHFRTVDYDCLSRAQHIRVKFWKLNSCDLSLTSPSSFWLQQAYSKEGIESKKKFTRTMKHPTIKKSMKSIKKFQFSSYALSNNRYLLQLGKSWKLDTLKTSLVPRDSTKRFFKPFINSKLKKCSLISCNESSTEELSPIFVSSFRRFNRCPLFIQRNRFDLKMLLNSDKLLSPSRLRPFISKIEKPNHEFVSNKAIINAPDSLEKISFECHDNPGREFHRIPTLPPLPNLKKLQFSWVNSTGDHRIEDISFVGQYSNLESLSLQLGCRDTETLDFLMNLPLLKEFSFSSRQSHDRKGPMRTLPNLTNLEKFSLQLIEPIILTTNHIRDFISKNKALKHLKLSLSIQNIGNIFEGEDDDNLIFPPIESLHLDLISCERPYAGAAKTIAQTLKKLDSVRKLSMEIGPSYADLNATLLKQGVASVKSLEEFTLKYRMTGGLEENKWKHLKDVFANLENLKSLDLDLSSDPLSSTEFSSILDGLGRLKHLEKLSFKGKLLKLTPAASDKLLSFLVSIRHLSNFKISLQGIPEEDGVKLKKSLLPKFPLSQDPFLFIPNI